MIKIALCGKIASGKSYIARLLHANYGFEVVTIARPIYTAAAISRRYIKDDDLFPYHLHDFIGTLTDFDPKPIVAEWVSLMAKHSDVLLSDIKPRGFLQDFGSMMRSYDEEVFIRAAVEAADGNAVCDDCRMMNEVWGFRDVGWKIVKVDVPEAVRLKRVAQLYPEQQALLGHVTETALDGFDGYDYVFDGSVQLAEVPAGIEKMLSHFSAE